MKKWYLLLVLALLVNIAAARAEEQNYYTSNEDRYYHLNPDCDRPASELWHGLERTVYERAAYQKYPVSAAAAQEFGKAACPVCVDIFEPLYLGDDFPEWEYAALPWEISGLDMQQQSDFRKHADRDYLDEIIETEAAFEAYYETVWDDETQQHVRRHEYPAFYGGRYSANSLCCTYLVVRPDDEILNTFRRMFGGGAWIISAKYGYGEMEAERTRVFDELIAWCNAHPETDAKPVSAGVDDYENTVTIGIDGDDWQTAAAAMDETAAVYVHFIREEEASWM